MAVTLEQRILDLATAGHDTASVARWLGVDESAVNAALVDLTIDGASREQRIQALMFAGHSDADVARWLAVTEGVVLAALRDLAVQPVPAIAPSSIVSVSSPPLSGDAPIWSGSEWSPGSAGGTPFARVAWNTPGFNTDPAGTLVTVPGFSLSLDAAPVHVAAGGQWGNVQIVNESGADLNLLYVELSVWSEDLVNAVGIYNRERGITIPPSVADQPHILSLAELDGTFTGSGVGSDLSVIGDYSGEPNNVAIQTAAGGIYATRLVLKVVP